MAYEAGKTGGNRPTVFNAANEYMVGKFLKRECGFTDILTGIRKALFSSGFRIRCFLHLQFLSNVTHKILYMNNSYFSNFSNIEFNTEEYIRKKNNNEIIKICGNEYFVVEFKIIFYHFLRLIVLIFII
jgi:1-deoxy-D-xylulose 5-phosphate reductoisomerase